MKKQKFNRPSIPQHKELSEGKYRPKTIKQKKKEALEEEMEKEIYEYTR